MKAQLLYYQIERISHVSITSPSSTHVARQFEVDVDDPTDPPAGDDIDTLTTDGTSTGTPNLRTGIAGYANDFEATQAEYDAIEASDDNRWQITDPDAGDNAVFWAKFKIAESPADIIQIDVKLEGYQEFAQDKAWLGIWRPGATTPHWKYLEAAMATSDYEYTGVITTNISEYIDGSGYLHVIFFNVSVSCSLYVDYVEVKITYSAVAPPDQVTGLSATAVGSQIDLSWTAPNDNGSPITGYKIERRLCGDTWSTLVADTGTTATTYSDTTVAAATCYGYRVSAINEGGPGPASTEATATSNASEDQYERTSIASFSTMSSSFTDVTGGTLTFTPSASSEIWVLLVSAKLKSSSILQAAAEA